jgi:hypothetical protein
MAVSVIHTRQAAGIAQHYIEAEAFKATGRSLVACRILARRPLVGRATADALAAVFGGLPQLARG